MDDYQSLSHTKWKCKYHVVFIPKYRKKVLYGGNRSLPSFHTKKELDKKEDHDSLTVTTFFTRSIHVLSSHASIQRRVAKNR